MDRNYFGNTIKATQRRQLLRTIHPILIELFLAMENSIYVCRLTSGVRDCTGPVVNARPLLYQPPLPVGLYVIPINMPLDNQSPPRFGRKSTERRGQISAANLFARTLPGRPVDAGRTHRCLRP